MRATKIERKVEYKDINASDMRATSDALGIIEGFANRTGNVDFQDDRTVYGAWRKTLADAYARKAAQNLDYLFPYLYNHSWDQLPPGGVVSAEETHDGLYVKVQLNLDIQSGREVFASFKAGTLSKQSVGYRTIACDYVKDQASGRTIRELKELALLECSCVVFPANDLAQVTTVKNRSMFPMPHRTLAPPLKDFTDRYAVQQTNDWAYDDWGDVASALHQSILDLFAPGGDPEADLETQVIPGLLSALRQYVADGVALGYSPADSSTYDYMSRGGAYGTKEGRMLSAANHARLTKAADGIMGHVKDIKSMLSEARRAGQLQGWPVYGEASSSNYFEEKEDAEDARALLGTLATRLEVENDLREMHEIAMETSAASSPSAQVNAALSNLIASHNKRR